MNINSNSLRSKMIGAIVLIVALTYTVIMSVTIIRFFQIQKQSIYAEANETASHYAADISNLLNKQMANLRTYGLIVESTTELPHNEKIDILKQSLYRLITKQQYLTCYLEVYRGTYFDSAYTVKGFRHSISWDPNALNLEFVDDDKYTSEDSLYFTEPVNTRQEALIDPYEYTFTSTNLKTWMVSLCVPLTIKNQIAGIVGGDFSLETIQKIVASIKPYNTGYAMLISNNGSFVTNPKSSLLGTAASNDNLFKGFSIGADIKNGKSISITTYDKNIKQKIHLAGAPVKVGSTPTPWSLLVAFPEKTIFSPIYKLISNLIILSILGLILVSVAVGFVTSRILKPVKSATNSMQEIADGDGDLTRRMPVQSSDEIGQMSSAFNTFVNKILTVFRVVKEDACQLSNDSNSLSKTSVALSKLSEKIYINAQSVVSSSTEVNCFVNSISESTNQMSTNVTSIASAVEELSSSINEVSKQCQYELTVASKANQKAGETKTIVNDLHKSAKEVGDVGILIRKIADQTRLLSLNASIEAASAGEAGRGFAIVAGEVKDLAKKSFDATGKIQEKIDDIQRNSNSTITVMNEIVSMVEQMHSISLTIATAIEQQCSTINQVAQNINYTKQSSNEIAKNVSHSANTLNDVTSSITDVYSEIENINVIVSEVKNSSSILSSISERLSNLVSKFKV